MKDDDVENNSAEQREGERNEAADQQEHSGKDLYGANRIDIAAGEEDPHEVAGEGLGNRRHREKTQKGVRAEDCEHEAEKHANDNGKNLHRARFWLSRVSRKAKFRPRLTAAR